MFFNFGLSEPMEVLLEQYIGNALISQHQLSLPPQVLQACFMFFVNKIMSQSQPMKVRIVRYEDIWNDIDGEWKRLELDVSFQNWKDDVDET